MKYKKLFYKKHHCIDVDKFPHVLDWALKAWNNNPITMIPNLNPRGYTPNYNPNNYRM